MKHSVWALCLVGCVMTTGEDTMPSSTGIDYSVLPCDTPEIAHDGVDQDCDGLDLLDADGDGYDADFAGGDDCDDGDVSVHPGAHDLWYDGVDSDCAGNDDFDADGDGSPVDDDCDDGDANSYPGAEEIWYDGIDQACDGGDDFDADGDGAVVSVDCDDTDPNISPLLDDAWYDGIDTNCDGADDYDADGDGDRAAHSGGTDCNDYDPTVEGLDADKDGFSICEGDCHDGTGERSPGLDEICGDGIDQDCSGIVDDHCPIGGPPIGRTYVSSFADIVLEPDLLGLLGASGNALMFQVADYDATSQSMDVLIGSAYSTSGFWFPECGTVLEQSGVDFSDDPNFQLGPIDYTMNYDGVDYTVEDFVVIGAFLAEGDGASDFVVAGRFDLRGVADMLDSACELTAVLGYPCEPCRDGEVRCLPFVGEADRVVSPDGLDLAAECS